MSRTIAIATQLHEHFQQIIEHFCTARSHDYTSRETHSTGTDIAGRLDSLENSDPKQLYSFAEQPHSTFLAIGVLEFITSMHNKLQLINKCRDLALS